MNGQGESTSSLLRSVMTNYPLKLGTRTLLRILRKDTFFFNVPNPQIGCFVILYTNNATVGPVAKDIVLGTVHADQLRDRDALTEQITPSNIEHIRVAGSNMFYSSKELKVVILSYSDLIRAIDFMLTK